MDDQTEKIKGDADGVSGEMGSLGYFKVCMLRSEVFFLPIVNKSYNFCDKLLTTWVFKGQSSVCFKSLILSITLQLYS